MALPFRLMLITDWSLGQDRLLGKIDKALRAGPGIAVHHRHKSATIRDFFTEGLKLREVCARHQAPLFINGRLDVALGLDAHLHLTSTSMRARDVRRLLPATRMISVAVHDAKEAKDTIEADLAVLSPIFAAGSKAARTDGVEADDRPPLGPLGFAALARLVNCPSFALGGMTAERLALLECDGVAVISAVLKAKDPTAAARALLDASAK